jgi:hypothetical protein
MRKTTQMMVMQTQVKLKSLLLEHGCDVPLYILAHTGDLPSHGSVQIG